MRFTRLLVIASFWLMVYFAIAVVTLIAAIVFAPDIADHCGGSGYMAALAILCFLITMRAWQIGRRRSPGATTAANDS